MNADQKQKAEQIVQNFTRLIATITVLDEDVRLAILDLKAEPTQFRHRNLIRCRCAACEAVLNLLISMIRPTAKYYGVALSISDRNLSRLTYSPFRAKIKSTFSIFAKAHGIGQFSIQDGDPGFEDLCKTFLVRNRLMHPLSGPTNCEVTDAESDTAGQGSHWFQVKLESLLKQCQEKLPFSKV